METTTTRPSGIQRYIPILTWLPHYQSKWLRLDIIAGLTIMALLVPEGMAYAQLAGMPPQTAFYAAPAGLILFAIFGTSRQLVVAVSSPWPSCQPPSSAGWRRPILKPSSF